VIVEPPSEGAEYTILITAPEVVVVSGEGGSRGVDGVEAIVTLSDDEVTDLPPML